MTRWSLTSSRRCVLSCASSHCIIAALLASDLRDEHRVNAPWLLTSSSVDAAAVVVVVVLLLSSWRHTHDTDTQIPIRTSGQSNLTWPHRRRTRTIQSYSPLGANVHPYIESQKMVAMAKSHRCRVSAISAFRRPTTQTRLLNQLSSRYRSRKAS